MPEIPLLLPADKEEVIEEEEVCVGSSGLRVELRVNKEGADDVEEDEV